MRSAVAAILMLLAVDAAPGRAQATWRAVRRGVVETDDPNRSSIALFPITSFLGPDDNLYLADPYHNNAIFVYSSAGKFVRQIGRKGRGPGEFGYLRGVGFRHDTIWTYDQNEHRISYFTMAGKFLTFAPHGMDPPNKGGLRTSANVVGFMADGSVITWAGASSEPGLWDSDVLFLLKPYPDVKSPALLIDSTPHLMEIGKKITPDKYPYIEPGPSPVKTRLDISQNGRGWVVVTPRVGKGYTVELRRSAAPPLVRDVDGEPKPLSRAAVAAWEDARVKEYETSSKKSGGALRHALDDAVSDIRYLSPVTAVRYGVDGTIWIRRDALDVKLAKPGETVRWDVLDQNAKVIGRVTLPANAQVAIATKTRLWTIEENEDGEDQLIRYDVVTH